MMSPSLYSISLISLNLASGSFTRSGSFSPFFSQHLNANVPSLCFTSTTLAEDIFLHNCKAISSCEKKKQMHYQIETMLICIVSAAIGKSSDNFKFNFEFSLHWLNLLDFLCSSVSVLVLLLMNLDVYVCCFDSLMS